MSPLSPHTSSTVRVTDPREPATLCSVKSLPLGLSLWETKPETVSPFKYNLVLQGRRKARKRWLVPGGGCALIRLQRGPCLLENGRRKTELDGNLQLAGGVGGSFFRLGPSESLSCRKMAWCCVAHAWAVSWEKACLGNGQGAFVLRFPTSPA